MKKTIFALMLAGVMASVAFGQSNPLRYVATLNQVGVNAPTASSVGENTLGSKIGFYYDDVGNYYAHGFYFPAGKTFCLISNGNLGQLRGAVGCMRSADGEVFINSSINGDWANDVLWEATIQITVYQ